MRFVVATPARARLLVTGPDAAAFVHRMSTQHVSTLSVGEARLNVLLTDKGRIVDVVHHVVVDDGIVIVGHKDGGVDLCAWLDRYFFTEKLTLTDLAPDSAIVVVDAATAELLVPGAGALAPWQARTAGALLAVRTFDVADEAGAATAAVVVVSRDPAAATLPAPTLSQESFDAARIAAGVPTLEVGEASTPLDLALHDAIHWAKGCYIGQEVIARLDTYGKQRKGLVGVVVDPAAHVAVGDAVVVGGAVVGAVTSSSTQPWCPSLPRALALVKGVDVDAAEGEGDGGVDAVVRNSGGDVPARLVKRRAAQRPHD
jgi:folate-binding protein YgfZ